MQTPPSPSRYLDLPDYDSIIAQRRARDARLQAYLQKFVVFVFFCAVTPFICLCVALADGWRP